MPTLPHLPTLLTFLYILILNQTCHKKATILHYHATVVWMCPVKFKNILRIIFVVGEVKITSR